MEAAAGQGTVPKAAIRRTGPGFVERTLAGLSEAVERDLLTQELASLTGPLQALDPRSKVVAAAIIVVTTSVIAHLPVLVALYAVVLAVGLGARLPASILVRRVWLVLPLFTVAVAVPAIFSLVTPGPAVLSFGRLGSTELAITSPGLRTALTLIMRVATSVSAVLLLVVTTRWVELLRALRAVRIPQIFVLVLAMTYRYIFVLAHVANAMFLARKSRSVGPISGAMARRWVGGTASSLLGKSYHLSSEVYFAMLSRGFRGEPVAVSERRLRASDIVALVGVAIACAGFLALDRLYAGPW